MKLLSNFCELNKHDNENIELLSDMYTFWQNSSPLFI